MRAEIFSVGTELLLGQIVDTNAQFVAQHLPALGIDLYYVSQIGDNLGRLSEAFRRALERSDVVICTGGLGPTEDDLTREAIAAALGEQMQVQPELERELRERFAQRARTMPDRNVKQATTIPSCTAIPNPVGTAPGWWVEKRGTIIVAMPGVPHEMQKMWLEQAMPRLAQRVGAGAIVSRTLKLVGVGESHAEEALGELTRSSNPTLATYAKSDGVHVRLTAKAASPEEAERMLTEFEPPVRARVDAWVYGVDDASFPSTVGGLLRARDLLLAVAESATGGHLAGLITDAPGSADYFLGGTVVYSRLAKERLGVPRATLDEHGTISEATTCALVQAVRQWYGADVAIATTGVAGPQPIDTVPPGTLYVAVDLCGEVTSHALRYTTGRAEFKRRGSLDALAVLWRRLRDG